MKRTHLLLSTAVALASSPLVIAAPYFDWKNDYTGNESNTLLLWKFDQGAGILDSSGNGHSVAFATPTANATVGQEDGMFGQAFYSANRSAANDSYAQGTASAGVFSINAISVEFWFKPVVDGVATGNHSYFFDKKFAANAGIFLRLNNVNTNSGVLELSVGNGTTSQSLLTGNLDWDEDTWYHVAVTYENVGGDGVLKIFRDGNMLNTSSVAGFGDLSNSVNFWRLGNRLGSGYGSAPGYYDNFRVSSVAYDYAPIPEPATALLLPLGLTGAFLIKKRIGH